MEPIEKTMRVFGEDRTAYNQREVRQLLEIRDKLHKEENDNYLVAIASLIIVCFFMGFAILNLW